MKFKKGDHVRVKPWKRMAEDSRVHIDASGDITDNKLPHTFTRQMERFCKCTANIQLIGDNGDIFLVFDGEQVGPGYRFREWMLEFVEEDKPDSIKVIMVHHDSEREGEDE